MAGSEAERRAAKEWATRLESMGRAVTIEPTRVAPAFATTHLIHAIAAVVGSVLAVYAPVVGLALLVAVTVSTFGELAGTFPFVRLLTSARASQNVVSADGDTDKPGLLVVVANYDTPRAGMLLERSWLRRWPSLLFWSVVVVTICALARVLGFDATWLTIIQFIPTVALIALSPLFVDVALSGPRVGVDAGRTADAAVRLAERYGGRLEHFDLIVLLTGGSAHFALGMRAWLSRHRRELNPETTAVIVLEDDGDASRYAMKEGPVFATRLHPTLIDLVADDGTPVVSRDLSDAYAARAAGLPAIRVTSDLAPGLIERIDAEIGPELA